MKTIFVTKPFGCWFPGDVAGFADDFADQIVALGAGAVVVTDPAAEPSDAEAAASEPSDPGADTSVVPDAAAEPVAEEVAVVVTDPTAEPSDAEAAASDPSAPGTDASSDLLTSRRSRPAR